MIPVDGIENFPLMGRAIFQKAAKRGDFFQKQVIFRSAWARLMAGRSKHVRYDIDGGDMLAYGLHSGSFPGHAIFFATLIMTEYPFKLKDDVQRMQTVKRHFRVGRGRLFASSFAFRSRANILGDDRNPPCHPEGVGCLRLRSSRIDLPSSSNDSR
jgi:hypothetical protein